MRRKSGNSVESERAGAVDPKETCITFQYGTILARVSVTSEQAVPKSSGIRSFFFAE